MANNNVLTEMEIDAIGEVMNISMGSAATAVSTMLDKTVDITVPKVSIQTLNDFNYTSLEPAMLVKITYVEGISGSNVMVFSQSDMQVIINQLMGIDEPPKPDFVFDELSMSAACEVMNQMMGASATALSDFLGRSINISTPQSTIMDAKNTFMSSVDVDPSEQIVSIVFSLEIKDVMKSQFYSVLTIDLAKMIVSQIMESNVKEKPLIQAEKPLPETTPLQTASQPVQQVVQQAMPQQTAQQPVQPMVQQTAPLQIPAQQPVQPQIQYAQPVYQQPYIPPQYQPQYQVPEQVQPAVIKQQVNVQPVQFPTFNPQSISGVPVMGGNMELLMNVSLNVSVEIGKTKKKIRDIMELSPGSVIELEKQAGAPVDIVVNGQLIARGDVVVIDDNFGVRITEIIGTKDLLQTLDKN